MRMLYLAPLHGFTDYYFRNAFARHFGGIDIAITPFIPLVSGRKVKYNHIKDLWPENNTLMPVIPQVIGNDSQQFIMMANQLYDMGYESINWNLGCPIRGIARKKRGSGMLAYPDIIQEKLDEILPEIKNKFSLKVRLGYLHENEIDKLIPVFNQYNFEFIIIHPRIGIQMYEGDINLDKFKECLSGLNHNIIYNGDINSSVDLNRLQEMFPSVKSWMLGRGVMKNLFLPMEIQEGRILAPDQKLLIFKAFHEELFQEIPKRIVKEKSYVNKLKEYWGSFYEMFEDGEKMLMRIRSASGVDDIEKVIREEMLDQRCKIKDQR
ncbi:tRNA-dihydrouridine synthase family protein [Bacteroidota bacterium]